MSDNKELAGKVAVVTGAGRNIGRAIALALADGGASVVVNVRSNKEEADKVVGEIKAAGGKAVPVLGDVADPKVAEAMAAAAMKAFGRIDILVNNAALRREKSITEMSYDEWREVIGIILDGSFYCVKACLPALRKNGGTIVNIGGMSAHIGSKGRAHVMTAKAALVGFSRALAHDLAEDKITANCVVPGAIGTSRPSTSLTPAHHLTHGTITGERGKPEDVAAMVRFLAGPGARNVTGQTLHVNAGAYLGS
jgi:3-oxoacyl-[acyl-carrier protein] reductase